MESSGVMYRKQVKMSSLVPRPLPDFISQPWRKIGRTPGTIIRHGPEMVDLVST